MTAEEQEDGSEQQDKPGSCIYTYPPVPSRQTTIQLIKVMGRLVDGVDVEQLLNAGAQRVGPCSQRHHARGARIR